jgi:hypothetical protein
MDTLLQVENILPNVLEQPEALYGFVAASGAAPKCPQHIPKRGMALRLRAPVALVLIRLSS